MPAIKARELAKMIKSDGQKAFSHLTEALEKKQLRAEDFSIRDLAENLVPDGREWVESMNPRFAGSVTLRESDAVKTTDFANITGQIAYSKIKEAFEAEPFVFSKMIPTVPTQFDGEKIPGITGLGDQAAVVEESDPYPMAGVSEDWISTPQTKKRGFIVPVTKEAIFFDRTGRILAECSRVGESLGINKEKRAINCVIDENTTTHRYNWKGTVYATYATSGGHGVVNKITSNSLVDWSDLDAIEQLFNNMVDPYTGEPIMVMADTLIVTPSMKNQADFIMTSTGVALQAGGFAVTGNMYQTSGGNRVNRYNVVTSRLLPTLLATDTHYFLGTPSKAFAYMENWGLKVEQADSNSEDAFNRDIVVKYKASERGTYATLEPRCMVRSE